MAYGVLERAISPTNEGSIFGGGGLAGLFGGGGSDTLAGGDSGGDGGDWLDALASNPIIGMMPRIGGAIGDMADRRTLNQARQYELAQKRRDAELRHNWAVKLRAAGKDEAADQVELGNESTVYSEQSQQSRLDQEIAARKEAADLSYKQSQSYVDQQFRDKYGTTVDAIEKNVPEGLQQMSIPGAQGPMPAGASQVVQGKPDQKGLFAAQQLSGLTDLTADEATLLNDAAYGGPQKYADALGTVKSNRIQKQQEARASIPQDIAAQSQADINALANPPKVPPPKSEVNDTNNAIIKYYGLPADATATQIQRVKEAIPLGKGAEVAGNIANEIAVQKRADEAQGITITKDENGNDVVQIGGKKSSGNTVKDVQDADFLTRGKFADKQLATTDASLSGFWDNAAQQYAPDLIKRYFQSPAYQYAKRAADDFVNSTLRPDTGAAYGPEELSRYASMLTPQPGDRPEMIKVKADARHVILFANEMSHQAGKDGKISRDLIEKELNNIMEEEKKYIPDVPGSSGVAAPPNNLGTGGTRKTSTGIEWGIPNP